MSEELTVGFVQPVVSQPRYRKRAEGLRRLGLRVRILSFQRGYFAGKPFEDGLVILGRVDRGRYITRILKLAGALSLARKHLREVSVIYAFGLDMLAVSWLACFVLSRKKKFVYEVGDIMRVSLRQNVGSRVVRFIERFLLKQIDLLVVTSEAFVEKYFQTIQAMKKTSYMVIENKVDESVFTIDYNKRGMSLVGKIRIGYFGVIRCEKSWEILKRLVQESEGNIEVVTRGIPRDIDGFLDDIQTVEGLIYLGPYIAPDDLPMMYDEVNLVWACFPYQDKVLGSAHWARTNRFYEACFFKRPIIAQKGTIDGDLVTKYEIGISLDLSDISGSVRCILDLDHDEIKQWEQNLYLLEKSLYCYVDEHKQLMNMIS